MFYFYVLMIVPSISITLFNNLADGNFFLKDKFLCWNSEVCVVWHCFLCGKIVLMQAKSWWLLCCYFFQLTRKPTSPLSIVVILIPVPWRLVGADQQTQMTLQQGCQIHFQDSDLSQHIGSTCCLVLQSLNLADGGGKF